MNTIFSSQKENAGNNKPSEGVQESIYPYRHEINKMDGAEFLDDGIRMNDQPFGETTTQEKENE